MFPVITNMTFYKPWFQSVMFPVITNMTFFKPWFQPTVMLFFHTTLITHYQISSGQSGVMASYPTQTISNLLPGRNTAYKTSIDNKLHCILVYFSTSDFCRHLAGDWQITLIDMYTITHMSNLLLTIAIGMRVIYTRCQQPIEHTQAIKHTHTQYVHEHLIKLDGNQFSINIDHPREINGRNVSATAGMRTGKNSIPLLSLHVLALIGQYVLGNVFTSQVCSHLDTGSKPKWAFTGRCV